ncbi:hypothetical protein SDC9_138349 [bioreactor metagenome]|uniref:Uncharacterized protein n=1 Tax=bioreactor metagenome TaxID=1076179 RepID=A0A645DRY9_9ZZZZ
MEIGKNLADAFAGQLETDVDFGKPRDLGRLVVIAFHLADTLYRVLHLGVDRGHLLAHVAEPGMHAPLEDGTP